MAFDPDAYLNEGKKTSGFDPDAYLGAQPGSGGGNPPLGFVAKQILNLSPLAHPVRNAVAALPIAGGIMGGPIGAAGGEFAREAANTVLDPSSVPQTALGRFASTVGAGIAQEPKILNAIPGVPQVSKMVGNLASKAGTNAAKFAEAVTGGKAKDFMQAAKQGYSTYAAPSMEKAQKIFGKAMESAGIPGRPPLKQIIDPQLATARKVALQIGDKLEKGLDIGAGEALQARQAIDRIYNATPLRDRSTLSNLSELRTKFDDVIAGKSGALKEASSLYRKAIVKSNLLNPFRITKQGQMSAVTPMIATLAAGAGLGSGHKGESAMGGLGALAVSSPLIAGLGFTSAGQAAKAINAIGQNPAARQILLQVLQRLTQGKEQQPQEQP